VKLGTGVGYLHFLLRRYSIYSRDIRGVATQKGPGLGAHYKFYYVAVALEALLAIS
jgi:hypothetical protein